ncbi:hypothetical protein BM529_01190, partial [Clostridioides difficile]
MNNLTESKSSKFWVIKFIIKLLYDRFVSFIFVILLALNDPYGFTYKEMSEVIGEDKARALYAELYKQPFHKK